jgi:hypothetical protein
MTKQFRQGVFIIINAGYFYAGRIIHDYYEGFFTVLIIW